MAREACLTAEQLLDLWNDRLPAEQETIHTDHLGHCPTCRRLAESLCEDEPFRAYFQKHARAPQPLPDWVADLARSPALLAREGVLDGDSALLPWEQETHLSPASVDPLGTDIGPYKLRELLGEGGMGVVYAATQTEPIRRTVALKIVKPGMDSKEVLARFETERQALALMSHPHVAKILDGGTTDTGRPYFVMELVKGIPITEFCDQRKLNLRERLELFRLVCLAVQHAHLKGIIHRDLKPNNVLVELHDVTPVPKVIDFGIAKAINQQLTEHVVYTQLAQFIGTPLYVSPEQAQQSGLDVDTRSDTYSLGVLLYELLTGTTPFDGSTLRRVGLDEMRRMIREDEPPRPSHKLNMLDDKSVSTISERRQVDPRQLSLSLRRELDWIVMKCLEKDRNRRYESASALAQDVQRYLDDEPVLACPPSVGYRFRKYTKRHAALLATTTLVLISAIIGTVVSLSYATQATRSADTAKAARTDAEQHALKAERNALEVERANAWSRTLLYAADMKLASDAIRNDDGPRAAELIERHVPDAGEEDQRGFEWHFFHKRIIKPHGVALDQGAWVDAVEVSPDGNWLATTALLGTVRLYETATWTKQRSWFTLTESVHGLAWSPDSRRLAGACADGSLRLWDVSSGSQLLKIPAHAGGANDVVFTPDGRALYSCGADNFAKQWDVETGQELLVFTGHQREVERIALSPDGSQLATASSDGTFAIWDAKTAKRQHRLDYDHDGRIVCVAFSPDGRQVAAGNVNGYLYLADVKSGTSQLLTRELDGVEALTFLSGGKWLATANRGGAIHLYKTPVESGLPVKPGLVSTLRWVAHEGRALSLTPIRNGESLISGGRDGQVRVWTPDVQGTRWYLPVDPDCWDIETGPDNRLYLAGRGINVWDVDQRRLVDSFAAADSPWHDLACSRNGQFLAAVRAGQLALFDLATQQVIKEWPLDQQIESGPLAISTDGRFIADASDWEYVVLYDRDSSHPPQQFPAEQCHCVAFSPDGRWLAAGHMDDVRLFDLEAGGPPRVLTGHSSTLSGVAFSPDGQWLATVGHDRLLKIWRVATGEERFSLVAHPDRVNSVTFSPDGQTIATCGKDHVAKLWHVATGQPLGSPMPENTKFHKVRFTGDGRRLIGYLYGSLIVVYDAATPHEAQGVERRALAGQNPSPEFASARTKEAVEQRGQSGEIQRGG